MDMTPMTAMVYVDRAFDQMLAVVDRLGEALVNERPHGPDTNAVAGLVVHCCGVAEFWLGHVALARPSERARDDEFSTTATVDELQHLIATTIAQIRQDLARLEAGEGTDDGGRQFLPASDVSDSSVVIHVIEELYQHLGHMDLTADALTSR